MLWPPRCATNVASRAERVNHANSEGLIINYGEGGGTKWSGKGQVKLYPYKRGGGSSHAEGGGGTKRFEAFLMRDVRRWKGGGGGGKVFPTRDFPI